MIDKINVTIEESVSLNGADHYLFHSRTNYDNPILLYLHGSPGPHLENGWQAPLKRLCIISRFVY
ncbi:MULTISPECIES: hypothetical protein [unclassified Lysinibacillus]|uniref:hypothetical protein n=1 Tax=Lysinibacillus sp. NPDC093692 TaxID=3390578 RepID=UPI001116C5C0